MNKRKASVALDLINEGDSSNIHRDRSSNDTTSSGLAHRNIEDNINIIQHQNGSSASINVINACQQQDLSNNQNDNSIGSNCSGNNSSNGGSQSHKNKKERADNWSNAEIQVLHKGIESRRDIFYGPPSQATKKNREQAWEAITGEVNAVSTTPRSVNQVMKKFKNEKCRAKRKFTETDKESVGNSSGKSLTLGTNNNNPRTNNKNLNNVSNSSHDDSTNASTNNGATNNSNFDANNSTRNHTNSQQQQAQMPQSTHHMTSNEQSLSVSQPSINVVKLAPQNVAKTMIDLPGHVQQIQMPNDDMVLIVPPDMDGILSGVNIVSDGNGHHHFQKSSSALNNHPHNHHNQHSLQTLNTSQTLVNGTMSGGMVARTIPASSMCSLVYTTGNEVCAPEHHVTQNISGQTSLAPHHLGLNAQNLAHQRATVDHNQLQQQHHQLHHHQSQQHQQAQQQQQHVSHQTHLSNNQQNLSQTHLNTTTGITNAGGVAVESQLKNLLFNLLLKDGQHPSMSMINSNNQDDKHRNDMLAIIASSLTKIEIHLSKISRVAASLVAQNINMEDTSGVGAVGNQININNSDGNNNDVNMPTTASSMQANRRD